MNDAKTLLINQLEAFAKTMKQAHEDSLVLVMGTWVRINDDSHTCGTAACICGYQALSGELEHFERAYRISETSNWLDEKRKISDTASEISDDFDDATREVFSKDNLAGSVWSCSNESRYSAADRSGLFSDKEMNSSKHLNTESSPQEAYEYLLLCIDKVNKYQG